MVASPDAGSDAVNLPTCPTPLRLPPWQDAAKEYVDAGRRIRDLGGSFHAGGSFMTSRLPGFTPG